MVIKDNLKTPASLAKIRAHLPELSVSEARVANWILSNVHGIPNLSMNEIAIRCEVSDTTVLRFCRNSGFQGFMDLKISIIRDTHEPSQMIHDKINSEDDLQDMIKKVFLSNIKALQDTVAVMDFEAFSKAIDMIQKARRILIIGVGTSIPVVMDMYSKFFRLGLDCKAQTDSYLQLMEAALLKSKDLVIAISQSGSSSDPVFTLKQAKENGTGTICITGNARSPITAHADVILLSVSEETRPETIASRIAQITIVDALYIVLALKDLENAVQAEKRIWDAIICKTI